MQKIYFYLLISFGLSAQAQSSYYPNKRASLDINNLKVTLSSIGEFGYPFEDNQMPNGSGKNCLFTQSLWLGGKTENGNLKVAAQTYRQVGSDYRPGPLLSTPMTNATDSMYDKVYKISRQEIVNHILNYSNPNYTMPSSIEQWPGTSTTPFQTLVDKLAPYKDVNSNGVYEPSLGDYPLIRGDYALFVIYNDKRVHKVTEAEPLEMEIRLMLYGYETSDPILANTLFMNYKLISGSTEELKDFVATMFTDLDIGHSGDDYIGSDSSRNLVFGYNGDNWDENTSGYGVNPPAFGLVSLDQNLSSSFTFNNTNDPKNGNPHIGPDYYQYMNGKLKTGESMNVLDTNYPNTNFIYNHSIPYTESQVGNLPDDRRILASIDRDVFEPGSVVCYDYAMIFAHDTSLNNLQQVDYLFEMTDSIQAFYDQKDWDCNEFEDVLSAERYENNNSDVEVINKLNSWQIITKKKISNIQVFDVLGKRVLPNVLKENNIDYSSLPQGVYFIRLQDEEGQVKSIKVLK
jgi:hypothetical protein